MTTNMDAKEYEPYVTTYTGRKIYIRNPTEESVHLDDITHQTALKCRFGGAVNQFYSVAQHSVYCYWAAKKADLNLATQVACLIHDANEGPYPDIQRPIKIFLPQWKLVEDPLEDVIYKKYIGDRVSEVDWQYLKKIDNVMLVLEARELVKDNTWSYEDHWKANFKDTPFDWNGDIDQIAEPFFLPWEWQLAKVRFKRELDNVSQLMVALDPEWNAIRKEIRPDEYE